MERSLGIAPLSTAQGLEFFELALSSGKPRMLAIQGNAAKVKKIPGLKTPEKQPAPKRKNTQSPDSDLIKAREKLVADLRDMAAGILKVDAEELEPEANISQYGFDSISFTKFANLLNNKFDLEINPPEMFENPSIRELGEHLWAEYESLFRNFYQTDAKDEEATPLSEARDKLAADLVEMAAGILKVDPDELDPEENISQYGFDSISFTKFANLLNNKLDLEINPPEMFENPTIQELSDHLWSEYENLFSEFYQPETKIETKIQKTGIEGKTIEVPALKTRPAIVAETAKVETALLSEIAVIGMSGRFPEAENLEEFRKNLEDGKDCISEIPAERWDFRLYDDPEKFCSKWGGFLKDIDKFDPEFFNISPREAKLMDPQQRIFLEIIWETLENAGLRASDLSGAGVGLFAGISGSSYYSFLRENGLISEAHASTGVSPSLLVNRVSYFFDWHGPSETVDTACSSSLVAVHRAVQAIRNGECDLAMAGGVNLILTPDLHLSFSSAGMLSPDGRCKTFDEDANGYVRSEGAGAILLKPLAKAIGDKDIIYGIIKGSAVNHGGRVSSLTAPNPKAQARVIVEAHQKAGIDPESVGYIECHGTGTSLGDPIEINGLKMAFKELYQKAGKEFSGSPRCALGSLKTNVGHLEMASGIAGIIKTLLAFQRKKLPGTIHLKKLNPYIKLDGSPFYILDSSQEWRPLRSESGEYFPPRAGVSSFGFGGTNAHVVLEAYQEPDDISQINNSLPLLITMSAKNRERLKDYAKRMAQFVESNAGIDLSDLVYTTQIGREAMEERLALLVESREDILSQLKKYLEDNKETSRLFLGNARKDRTKTDILLEGDEGAEFLRAVVKRKKFDKLARLWVSGVEIDWNQIYGDLKPRRIALPAYSFARERYWVEGYETTPARSVLPDTIPASETEEPYNDIEESSNNIEVIVSYLKKNLAELIQKPESSLDIHNDIESYGLDSIVINELTSRLEDVIGKKDPSLFFSSRTIYELAVNIEKSHGAFPTPKQTPELAEKPKEIKKSYPDSRSKDIAVIGISGKYPESDDLYDFFRNLKAGRDCVIEVPEDRWDSDILGEKSNYGGFISDVYSFDNDNFQISFNEALAMHPEERILLERAWHCFENAGYNPFGWRGDDSNDIGVYIGASFHDYQYIVSELNAESEQYLPFTSQIYSYANRLSYFFNLTGPSVALDTACSSSLQAVFDACLAIRAGVCKAAIAGGINLQLHPSKFKLLSEYNFLSPNGKCYSFAEGGEGYAPGEGVGLVFLKSLDEAIRDNDNILAVIKGAAAGNDGKTNGFTVPNPDAQSRVIEKALADADISPETISFVECHGTGTALGDPIEISALTKTFGKYASGTQYCAVSSVKSNIGHLEAAAGVAQLTKVILQLKNKLLFPNVMHSSSTNKNIRFSETPFYVKKELSHWDNKESQTPRRAGISSFGAGGANVHIILEEYNGGASQKNEDSDRYFIAPFSADSKERLIEIIGVVIDYLSDPERNIFNCEQTLKNIAGSLALGRASKKFRAAIVSANNRRLFLKSLVRAVECLENDEFDSRDIFYGVSGGSLIPEKESLDQTPDFSVDKLRNMARFWTGGKISLDKRFYSGFRKICLPGYPFNKKTIRFQSHKPTQSASIKSNAEEKPREIISPKPSESPSREQLKDWIISVFKQALGKLPDNFDENVEFSYYGLDSITGSRIHEELAAHHSNPKLDDFVLVEYNTLTSLTEHIFGTYYPEKAEEHEEEESAQGDSSEEVGKIKSLLSDESLTRDSLISFAQVVKGYEESGGELNIEIRRVRLLGGREMEFIICGQGKPVVFLPPFNSSASVWIQQILALSKSFQVIVLHPPGIGRSDWIKELGDFGDLARITLETIDKMLIDQHISHRKLVFVGWSFGGFLAQTIAVNYPEYVEKLILISTTTISWSSEEYNITGEDFSRKSALEFRENYSELPLFLRNMPEILDLKKEDKVERFVLGSMDRRVIDKYFLMIARFRHLEVAENIQSPTYLISGSDDELMPAKFAGQLHENIKNSAYYEVDGGKHFMSLFKHKIINEKLAGWIND